jgi:Mrp family chromosome partitioning ATPase
VVDADLRRPALHHLLELPNESGLADVLSGQVEGRDAVQMLTIQAASGVARTLGVLTSGAVSADSVHALGLPRLAETLAGLGAGFDFVLLDSPPVLAVNDAIVLSTVADMVLLVIRAGDAAEHEVRRARERLEASGGRVVGCVLTGCDAAAAEDGQHPYPRGERSLQD